ncbi:hypothetical protein BGW80DRAFT_1563266 [Lactifluus volemus]|nr:hypothetical protein BGW80DRAFT_1563266 [Lactifluus volemus]
MQREESMLYVQRDKILIGSWQEDEDIARPLEHSPAGLEQADDDIEHSRPLIGDVNLFFGNPCEDPEFDVDLGNDGSESWFRVLTMSSSPARF